MNKDVEWHDIYVKMKVKEIMHQLGSIQYKIKELDSYFFKKIVDGE